MPLEIHSAVQDSHNVDDAVAGQPKKHNVRPARYFQYPGRMSLHDRAIFGSAATVSIASLICRI
jgi:hypothetical protein